jgi:hypothetical protein
MNLSGGPIFGTPGTFTNAGTINWSSGIWTSQGGTEVVNQPGGLINIQCDDNLQGFNGGGLWLNTGTIRKSASTGTNAIYSITITNMGLLDLQSGGLNLQTTYNQTGGRINFGLASPSQYAGVSFSGTAPLDGMLSANLIGGYTPAAGTSFSVVTYPSSTGAFASFSLPPLSGADSWSETNNGTATILTVVAPPPVLTAMLIGGMLSVSWPSGAPGHNLYYTTNLTPPVAWQIVTNPVQVNGGQNVVSIPALGSTVFFELQ